MENNMNNNINNNINNNLNNSRNNKMKTKKKVILIVILITILFIIAAITVFAILTVREIDEHYDEWSKVSKPIVYLYPQEQTDVTVELGHPENITSSYPKYNNSWSVTACPDGTLIDKNNKKYYALYWEGKINSKNTNTGFVVKKDNLVSFLEEKLEILGLNYKEREEFIVYWLPELENNDYNYIYFMSDEEINENMPLNVSPEPDTIIRVWMKYKKVDSNYKVIEEKLTSPKRDGFTVVEWGGTKID